MLYQDGRFKLLEEHLREFDHQRREGGVNDPGNREEYAKEVAEWFKPCARWILAGHFVVSQKIGAEKTYREIYPTAIELYYHEEAEDGFKDPIMYHTNDRKKQDHLHKNRQAPHLYPVHPDFFETRGLKGLPYFPFGSFNPHTSGLDITFENPDKQYRASFLIREYSVKYGREGGKTLHVVNSTDIYDDMLIGGIPLDNVDWIEWKDGAKLTPEMIETRGRRNVAEYVLNNGLWEKNTKTEGRDSFTLGGGKYVKCPFQWQFRSLPRQAYEWLKKRRSKQEISTLEVLMKIKGYKWGGEELQKLEELDLSRFHDELLRIIVEEKEFVADFSKYKEQCFGLPYNITFMFKELYNNKTLLQEYKDAIKGKSCDYNFCIISNPNAKHNGIMLVGMNPSGDAGEELFDYSRCTGGFWNPKHEMMGKYDKYVAYVDLLPIRKTEQVTVGQIDNDYRARLLEVTQRHIEEMSPRLIIVVNKASMYYWGCNDDATWMGYQLGEPIKQIKGRWNLYRIQGLKTEKKDRINQEYFLERFNKTNLEGSYLLQYRQVTAWRHPKPEFTITEKDIESLLKEIDPEWEKTLY